MSAMLGNDWFMILLVSLCVVVAAYQYADRIVTYLEKRSLGSRDEIIRLLDLMFVEIDAKKVTISLLLLSFGLGTVVFLLLLPNVLMGIFFAALVTVAGWSFPIVLVKGMFERRADTLVAQMVDGLTIMANGIKSGLSVTQSMERVVENLPNPISQEFALVLSQIRLGRSVEEALADFGERIPKPDIQMFVTAINILKETGGNLAETFTTIVVTIRERQKIEKKIQAMTAQGLWQGIIISIVPILLILVFLFVDPSYVKPMFTTTFGLILLFLMFTLQIIGGLTIRKIVKIKV
jgi:tight adherence protein B